MNGPAVADPAEFDAFTENVKDPDADGVPDNTPAELNDNPVGREPESTEKLGTGDPDAVNANEYTVPTVAAAGAPEVNTGACVTTIVNGPAVADPAEFDAFTENVKDPDADGVPDNTPAELNNNPVGSVPESTEKLGTGDPGAVNPNEYADPTVAAAGAPEVITGACVTTIVNGPAAAEPAEFIALTANVNDPDVVGVPESTPAELSVNPVGSAPESTEKVGAGDPDAVKSNEYADPTVATAGVPEVITGARVTIIVNGPAVADPAELDAFTENVKEPAAVGVPERCPPILTVNPVGRLPEFTEKLGAGDPSAVKSNA